MVNKMREVRLAELHPAQQAIVDHPARFKVLACGRRFGKTTVAVDLICTHLLKGESAAYFAPTYRMTREVWEDVKRMLAPVIKQVREHDYRLELLTGGILDCWSLTGGAAETVRGRTYHFAVMDEAALFDSASVWHGAIRPLLTDSEGGALFASTPMGRNWFWNLYLQGLHGEDATWQSWRYPTLTNPYIKAAEVEAAREGMPERYFRQEYLAEFLDDGGVVFRNIEQVCSGEAMAEAEGGMTTFFGVDWGKDKDYTAVSVMTRDGRQIYLERFNQIGWAIQRGRLKALYDRFRPVVIMAETNSMGSVNIEALQHDGLPVQGFTTTAASKGPLIEALALAMETDEVVLLNDETLKGELMAYAMTQRGGRWSYGASAGMHDDTVMATALSLWAARRTGRVMISFI